MGAGGVLPPLIRLRLTPSIRNLYNITTVLYEGLYNQREYAFVKNLGGGRIMGAQARYMGHTHPPQYFKTLEKFLETDGPVLQVQQRC